MRPPGIYKQDYLTELFTRYGDVSDTPAAPPLPSWHTGSDDTDAREDENGDGEANEASTSGARFAYLICIIYGLKARHPSRGKRRLK